MSIFSLNWFKSNKTKELESLQIEEKKLKVELLKKDLILSERPYRFFKLVNDVLTVVLNDGQVLNKANVSRDDVELLKLAITEFDVLNIFLAKSPIAEKENDSEITEEEVKLQVSYEYHVLDECKDFIKIDNSYYFKEIDRSIPPLLIKSLIDVLKKHPPGVTLEANDEYVSLKRFFMWCCLNPRAEVSELLYSFLMKNSFRITKHGMFLALRNVRKVDSSSNSDQLDFVTNAYIKVKTVWKQKPDNFNVYSRLGEFKLIERGKDIPKEDNPYWELVGNLSVLYNQVPELEENRYTDAHTRTFDIRVGKVVNMPPEDCSWSTVDCGEAGLHFTANHINYVGCGDTSVLILINPMKVVGIGELKGRCYEYFPIMTVATEESTTLLHDIDFDTLQLDDEYADKQLSELETQVLNGFTAEVKKHEFNLPNISTKEMTDIISVLDKMKNDLRGRVQKIV